VKEYSLARVIAALELIFLAMFYLDYLTDRAREALDAFLPMNAFWGTVAAA
jgi:hypothetical protein